jgi:hypothetical protein
MLVQLQIKQSLAANDLSLKVSPFRRPDPLPA